MGDAPTFGRIIVIMFFFIGLFILFWFVTNIPEESIRTSAQFYVYLGVFGLILSAFGFIANKAGADFDVPLFSRETSFGYLSNKGILLMFLVIFLVSSVLIFNISSQGITAAIYTAPTFQIVELGPVGNGIVSFFAGIFEELSIIAGGFGISFFLLYHYTKNRTLSLILSIIIISILFGVVYHILRYGFTDMYGTISVTIMGLISTIWLATMKNPFLGMAFHGLNNFTIQVVKAGWTTQNIIFFFLPLTIVLFLIGIGKIYIFNGK